MKICIFLLQTTIIFKRRNEPHLSKKNGPKRKLNRKHFIYDIVEDTHNQPHKMIDVILTQYVERFGEKGDQLTLKPFTAYRNLLLPGYAVYATPENIEKFLSHTKVKTYSSKWASSTQTYLKKVLLLVDVSLDNPWVLEKYHLTASFRKANIHVSEDAITLPEKKITGPNLDIENKEFYITTTINKTEQVKVRCRINHHTFDEDRQLPRIKEFWNYAAEPIFPEDKEILDNMPKPYLADKTD